MVEDAPEQATRAKLLPGVTRWAAIALPECGFEIGFHPKTMATLKDITHTLIKSQHESVVENPSMAGS
jgi:hypothetical protein